MKDLSATAIASVLPSFEVYLPFIGTIDFTNYMIAILVFLVLLVIFKFLQIVIISRLQLLSKKTSTDIDDVIIDSIKGIKAWVYTIVALYISVQIVELPNIFDSVFSTVVYIAVGYQVIEIALKLIEYGTRRFLEKDEDREDRGRALDANAVNASHLIMIIAKIVLWSFGAIFILSNLGIEVTSLIAGLGIGGIAVALALQGVLSDLFASFSIYIDKPFKVGDYIILGTDSGIVERIGVKTTRIRTLQGEELVVSNAELTTARVQNFKKMKERRIASQFGITYETSSTKVKIVNSVVEKIFESIDGVRLDRVHFTTFADSALIFDVVYFVDSSDFGVFMDKQQQFNFALLDKFTELEIDFAYPTQTIYTKVV